MKKHFTLCHSEKRDDPFVPGEYVDTTIADMGTWATDEKAAWDFFNRMLDAPTLKRLNCWVREDKAGSAAPNVATGQPNVQVSHTEDGAKHAK